MWQAFINRNIAKSEKALGVPLDYVRFIAGASRPALWRLARFMRLVQIRKSPLATALHVASIAAAQAEDCGSCVQIGVNLARKGGVSPEILRAVIDREPARLPDDLCDVYRFAEAVTLNTDEQGGLRKRIQERFGDAGLIEIGLAIALHRVFPTLKRALGYATSCSVVVL